MISEFSLDDRVKRFQRVVGVWYGSDGEIQIGEEHVDVCLEAIICAPGSPVREESLAVFCDGLFSQKTVPAAMPIVQ